MQTFVPYADHISSARCLDRSRLGKQRVEGYQILNTLTGRSTGWRSHPATKMWVGHEAGLCAYILVICDEWINRGYADSITGKVLDIIEPDFDDYPDWWGDRRIHESHRANLVRKMPDYYGYMWPDADPQMPYYWPV